MFKKVMKCLFTMLMFAVILCFCQVPATVHADVTNVDNTETVELATDDDTEKDMEEDFIGYLKKVIPIALPAIVLLVLIIICLVRTLRKRGTIASYSNLIADYDRMYDTFKRYYAYCTEQIHKAEKLNFPHVHNNIMDAKEEILCIYNKLTEDKREFDAIKEVNNQDSVKKMNILYRRGIQDVTQLEKLLSLLTKYNKKNAL